MKESMHKSYDELPLFLNAETVARVLGISPSSIVVPKEQFIRWVLEHTGGGT